MRAFYEEIMKEIEFLCNEADDAKETARRLFMDMDKHDPTSIYYERVLERPQINWIRIILRIVVLSIIFIIALNFLLNLEMSFAFSASVPFTFLVFYIFFHLKEILICIIRIYQRYAPKATRMKCRFEPSCSQYMILALQKYGLLKGVKMGLKRLGRCKVGNGGYDFP